MLNARQQFGRAGEDAAVDFLRAGGYRILGHGVRGRFGEIDIVAEKAGALIFVEVKTRRDGGFGLPEEALTPAKRRHFRNAISAYLLERGLEGVRYRADLIAIDHAQDPPRIRHHESIGL